MILKMRNHTKEKQSRVFAQRRVSLAKLTNNNIKNQNFTCIISHKQTNKQREDKHINPHKGKPIQQTPATFRPKMKPKGQEERINTQDRAKPQPNDKPQAHTREHTQPTDTRNHNQTPDNLHILKT